MGLWVLAQQNHPALDLDSVQAFLVVKSCVFLLWKQALKQDCWNNCMGSVVQKPQWLPKTWAKVI